VKFNLVLEAQCAVVERCS